LFNITWAAPGDWTNHELTPPRFEALLFLLSSEAVYVDARRHYESIIHANKTKGSVFSDSAAARTVRWRWPPPF
jgi:hypothetical protein